MAEIIVPNLKSVETGPPGSRRLPGRTEQRGSQSGFSLWGIFLFGGVFVAIGLGVALVGARVIPVDPASVHAPYWALTAIGAVFAIAGLMVWGMAWKQYRSARRRREAEQIHPGDPAYADGDWDERGYAAPRWKTAARAIGTAAFLTLFLSIFNWWAFGADGPWPVKVVVVIFDLLALWAWWEAAIRLGRALKFGGSRIVFERFPYRVGAPLTISWVPAAGIGSAAKGTFTLRCVREWFETTGSDRNRHSTLVHEEQWTAAWSFDQECAFPPDAEIRLRFDLPAGLAPTSLSADCPIFWEFEAKLELPGLDFEELYLVPLYA